MTVCIAAITQGIVLVAADRMLTAGDIQFQPPTGKVSQINSSIVIMFSGDSSFHAEVLNDLYLETNTKIRASPTVWLTVKDVAELYLRHRNRAKLRRAESTLLAPLGLDIESFLNRQAGMDSALVEKIARDLIAFEVPDVSVIVAGIDDRFGMPRPSIYSIFGGEISCDDTVGFRAIGSGYRHAESLFMLARHSSIKPSPESLYTLYAAKKAAEIAPGVGDETDFFVIGPELGRFSAIPQELTQKIGDQFENAKTEERRVRENAAAEIHRFLESIETPSAEQGSTKGGEEPTALETGQPVPPASEQEDDAAPETQG